MYRVQVDYMFVFLPMLVRCTSPTASHRPQRYLSVWARTDKTPDPG